MYVIDASVYAPLIASCGRELVKAMKELEFILLDLTVYEVCNAFWKEHSKLHRISEDEAIQACMVSRALTRYARLYRVTDLDVKEIMEIAIKNNVTFYDSSYIALAHKLKTPLVTEDHDIIALAPKYNVEIVRLHELLNLIKTC